MSRPKKKGMRKNRNEVRRRRKFNRNQARNVHTADEEQTLEKAADYSAGTEVNDDVDDSALPSGVALSADVESSSEIRPVVASSSSTLDAVSDDDNKIHPIVVKSTDDDLDGSDIPPVVVKGPSDPLTGSDIQPVVVRETKQNAADPQPPATKERKTDESTYIGGWFSTEGVRDSQEDRFKVDTKSSFFAVFDGHGGDKASRYCEKHMEEYVMNEIKDLSEDPSDDDIDEAFKQAFIDLDEKFLEKRVDDGSTACVAYITNNGSKAKLHVANVGDSRAIVVCADGSVVEMSQDHKPDLPEEKKRIEAAYHDVEVVSDIYMGKRIKIARVDGCLAVSRAIGDGSLKDLMEPEKCAVTCVPEVKHLEVDPAKHRFLFIACDGIWDMYSNEDVAMIVKEEMEKNPSTVESLSRTCELICKGSIDKGSGDNCTALLVAL